MASFVVGIVGLTLAGCAALVVVLLPQAIDRLDEAARSPYVHDALQWPYGVAAVIAVLFAIPAVVCGSVAWWRARRAGVSASIAIAGFALGVLAVVLGGALATVEWLRTYGLV